MMQITANPWETHGETWKQGYLPICHAMGQSAAVKTPCNVQNANEINDVGQQGLQIVDQ